MCIVEGHDHNLTRIWNHLYVKDEKSKSNINVDLEPRYVE